MWHIFSCGAANSSSTETSSCTLQCKVHTSCLRLLSVCSICQFAPLSALHFWLCATFLMLAPKGLLAETTPGLLPAALLGPAACLSTAALLDMLPRGLDIAGLLMLPSGLLTAAPHESCSPSAAAPSLRSVLRRITCVPAVKSIHAHAEVFELQQTASLCGKNVGVVLKLFIRATCCEPNRFA
jgi:hypothetical protein